ncbi:NAD-dependent epimerase/dehydratase family protein [Aestuariibaculum sp. M13]|uniref:NAD-dependent epimerase/dehydratase family protein n=1 Tax=Aestuariibaculum sp. M13 TaxID=2967132 RepID=UPI002159F871|nr:NAD-dependent epimerase/dehydratase family protein [Aestuariibaculum sp. M13]MCR8668308.1 NAD-dependent epimerase/dehydratase family protein [Aestuariibaculum sp. M13]
MKVLVTGSTGYIGHQLALTLAKEHITVHALCRDIHSLKVPLHEKIVLFEGDICNKTSLKRAIKDCDYVFHTAAYTNLKCKSIQNFYQANVIGTENLLEVSLQHGIKKFVFTSSLSVYGPSYKDIPITEEQPRLSSYANDYELTKSMAEERVAAYAKQGLPYVILNVSKVYGPGVKTFSNGVNRLIELIAKKNVLFVPNRIEVTSNYVYIKDVVKAHIKAMKRNLANEKYIVGGDNISYSRLFEKIKTLTKSQTKIVKFNYGLVKTCLAVSSFLGNIIGKSGLSPQVLEALFVCRNSLSDKAKRELKYRTTSLEKGLIETINSLKVES